MDIDELIDNALKSSGGYLNPIKMYGVVGDQITNEVLVFALRELLTDNLRNFISGEEVSLVLLGIYTYESDARESVVSILSNNRLGTKGLIGSPGWYVLMADTLNNTLFSVPLFEYYSGYFTLFQYGAKATVGKVVLNVFGSKEGADECADIIRLYIKDDKGNIIDK